jgi:hypothetical protein
MNADARGWNQRRVRWAGARQFLLIRVQLRESAALPIPCVQAGPAGLADQAAHGARRPTLQLGRGEGYRPRLRPAAVSGDALPGLKKAPVPGHARNKGTGPCFRSGASFEWRRRLAEKWTSPRGRGGLRYSRPVGRYTERREVSLVGLADHASMVPVVPPYGSILSVGKPHRIGAFSCLTQVIPAIPRTRAIAASRSARMSSTRP